MTQPREFWSGSSGFILATIGALSDLVVFASSSATATTMKKRKSGSKDGKGGDSPSQLIDARIKKLSDWRGETLARVRILIKQADPARRNDLHR